MCSRRRRSGGDRYSTAGLETSRRNQNHRGVDAWLHLPWSLLYVCAGAIQIIAGIFYLMSLPVFRLGSNIYTGCWNVVVGISGGMLACVGPNGARRHEILMYLAISILTINVVNLLVLELGEWKHLLPESARKIIEHTDHQAAAHLARLSTSISSAITAIAAFIESQLAFCIINCCLPKGRNNRQKDGGSHDQGSDIEYIIPRPKTDSIRKLSNNIHNTYAQSWVFDSEAPGGEITTETSTPSMVTSSAPSTPMGAPAVLLQEASVSDSGSGRQIPHMASFSRAATPSPAPSMDHSPAPIYECLERLTGPIVYRARLDTAISTRRDDGGEDLSPSPRMCARQVSEEVQYASLMAELHQSLVDKKMAPSSASPEGTSESLTVSDKTTSKSSRDAEFSRELEAALQLIQELETPSEPCMGLPGLEPSHSGSDKTISAAVSLGELASPGVPPPIPNLHGKGLMCDSQSTSGYSSPSHTQTPSPRRQIPHRGYSIRESNTSAVISLFPLAAEKQNLAARKSITLLNVSEQGKVTVTENQISSATPSHHSSTETLRARQSPSGESPWNVRSLLRKKKTAVPKLSPELEAAIIKSESLAYLTDVELLARHERNREIQRKIEQRVQQQLSTGTLTPLDPRVDIAQVSR